jgi:hypothetical protein
MAVSKLAVGPFLARLPAETDLENRDSSLLPPELPPPPTDPPEYILLWPDEFAFALDLPGE